jgi:hypothetical protein
VILVEIVILFFLSRKMAAVCEERELSKPLYIFLLIAFWFTGEIIFVVITVIISQAVFGNGPLSSMIYGMMAGWVGAACGAFAAFAIAGLQRPPERPSLFQVESELAREAVRTRRRKRRPGRPRPADDRKTEEPKLVETLPPIPTVKVTKKAAEPKKGGEPDVIDDFHVVEERRPAPPRTAADRREDEDPRQRVRQ